MNRPANAGSPLELSVEELFQRITLKRERNIIRKIAEDIGSYMQHENQAPFMVAAVGSILRLDNPRDASDIDLVVVGLKAKDFTKFTREVDKYFQGFEGRCVVREKKKKRYSRMTSSSWSYHGLIHGPIKVKWEKEYFCESSPSIRRKKSKVEIPFQTYGLQVCYSRSRPIDVIFVYNKNPHEWKTFQRSWKDAASKEGKRADFPYAPIYEIRWTRP